MEPNHLLAIFDNSFEIVFIKTFDEKYVYSNNTLHKLLCVDKEELKKSGPTTFIHPDDVSKTETINDLAKNNADQNFNDTIRLITRNGDIHTLDINITLDSSTNNILITGTPNKSVNDDNLIGQATTMAQIGSWEYYTDSGILTWDDEVYKIYELNNSTPVNLERMKQFFRAESLEIFNEKLKNLIEHGVSFDEELGFVSGKFRPSTARFIARLSASKKNKIVGTVQDLTDMRRIERKAEDYQEAVDKSSIVAISDRSGVITEVNDKFCEITKYTKSELIGQSFSLISSGLHTEDFWKDLWETISRGEVWAGQIQNKAKDGSIYWVDVTIIPFKNSIGRIYQYVSIQRDFTENKKLNEELMVSEKLSSIGEISAQILHEVMTPLHIISLSIENLEDDIEEIKAEQENKKRIMTNLLEIKSNYDRIEEIFENMRSILVRKNNGKSSDIDINDTLNKTLSLVNAKLKSKDISIKINSSKDNLKIKCTQSDLSQVFLNLINNSVDAIDKLESRWIDISMKVESNNIVIRFQDSGSGIPVEIASRIFETLYTTKGENKGTGLGMGVCKKLIERHDGTISIDREAKNTTFVLTFPKI